MSRENPNEHMENFFLFIIVGALLLGGMLYGLFLFWPYFVFYVLPFVLGSVVIGFLFWFSVMPGDGELRFQYKRLAFLYPALILIMVLVFNMDSGRKILIDQNTQQQREVIEWPKAYKAFNESRRGSYAGSFFESLRKKARVEKMYDRDQIGMICWWVLFLGAPAMFFYLSRKDLEMEEAEITRRVDAKVKDRREVLDKKAESLEAVIQAKTSGLKDMIADLRSEKEVLVAENKVLKATVEFSTEIFRRSESVKTAGILDRDIL
jgi:hypothetical protein